MNLDLTIYHGITTDSVNGTQRTEIAVANVIDPNTEEVIDFREFIAIGGFVADTYYDACDYDVGDKGTMFLMILSWIYDVDQFEISFTEEHATVEGMVRLNNIEYDDVRTLGLLSVETTYTQKDFSTIASICIPSKASVHYGHCRSNDVVVSQDIAIEDAVFKTMYEDFTEVNIKHIEE